MAPPGSLSVRIDGGTVALLNGARLLLYDAMYAGPPREIMRRLAGDPGVRARAVTVEGCRQHTIAKMWAIPTLVVLLDEEGRAVASCATIVPSSGVESVALSVGIERATLVVRSSSDHRCRIAVIATSNGKSVRLAVDPRTSRRIEALDRGDYDVVLLDAKPNETVQRWRLTLEPGRELSWELPASR